MAALLEEAKVLPRFAQAGNHISLVRMLYGYIMAVYGCARVVLLKIELAVTWLQEKHG